MNDTKQYTIFEPIKTVRVTKVSAPAGLSKEEVYEHYNNAETDVEILDTDYDIEYEEVYDITNIEENS